MNPSLTSLIYDQCALNQRDTLSTEQFNLIVDPSIMESKKKCFQSQSPFVDNPYKSIPSQYIDIESELNGLNRLNSKCSANKYHIDTSEPKKMFLNNCQGENDLKMQYTRMKKSHNVKEHDEENEKIAHNNFYLQNLPNEKQNDKIESTIMDDQHYRYTRFDQNTRETLRRFIQDKKQNAKWLYQ